MNETTILEKRPTANEQQDTKKEGGAWKQVTLGGVSGILMGAGLLYAGQVVAQNLNSEEKSDDQPEDVAVPEPGETSHTLENGLKVAAVNDGMSFGEAFAAARAQVGPGGVFCWHGGVYGTYYADEWNAMTTAEKHEYAERVQPEIRANQVSTPTDAHPDVAVHHQTPTASVAEETDADVEFVTDIEQQIAENFKVSNDVHIVGYANAEGHLVVGYDTTGNGEADVAIIDVDDNYCPSDADIIMDKEGNMDTIGNLMNESDLNQQVSLENNDASPDMPDYVDGII